VNRGEIVKARRSGRCEEEMAVLFGLVSVMQNACVVGPSAADKTSILVRLADPQTQREHGLDPSQFLFCYLNLGSAKDIKPQQLFELMLLGMIRAASRCPRLIHLQSLPSPCDTTFRQLLSHVERAEMIGLNVVWALDDYDTACRNHERNLGFFSALRSLASRPNVALVAASRHPLSRWNEARRPVGSSLAGLFVTIRLDLP